MADLTSTQSAPMKARLTASVQVRSRVHVIALLLWHAGARMGRFVGWISMTANSNRTIRDREGPWPQKMSR
ncbi:hypothetical protein C8039_11980 [Halogeometricum sp. wsp3]|nr:hypothetical protein C8039_11980 [Halogeometricum sp. wsp3]